MITPNARLTNRTAALNRRPSIQRTRTATLRTTANVYGHTHWGGHYSSLSFAFGTSRFAGWGCYSYPFFYAANLPLYNNYCFSSFGYYRNGFGLSFGFWPRFCWGPRNWLFCSDWNYFCNQPYDLYYATGPSYVVVRDPNPISEVVTVGAGASLAADPGPTLASDPAPAETLSDAAERHLSLGDYYFKQGRFADASESYLRALAYAPDDGSIHFVIADALFAQGDYHYAAHMVSRGVILDSELVFADADKRTFYGEPGQFDKQMETLNAYVAEKPYDAAAHLLRGYNLHFSGEKPTAKVAFQRVIEIDPGNDIAPVFLESYESEKDGGADKPATDK